MKKSYIYILFGIMVLAQIIASAQIVYKYEHAIASENVYKFKTAPMDPNDPFRGKYISLNYQINFFKTKDDNWDNYKKGYAYFSRDKDGFAVLETLTKQPLSDSNFDYVEVELRNYHHDRIYFALPFNRYYMEESKAYDAEVLARKLSRDRKENNIYALVHIEKGTYVLTDIIVNGTSINEAVAK